jgi:ribosome maturation protein SDO1
MEFDEKFEIDEKQLKIKMSARVTKPVNQKRLTNVVIVRLKRGGKRFELACYPNKVTSWREGVEKDLDEVLQQSAVFTNVSKGVQANRADLKRCFKTDDEQKIIEMILARGELQVTGKERAHKSEQLFRDVATSVAERCVDTNTQRPMTVGMVERALKEIQFRVHPNQPAKKQALEAIKALQAVMPIERARMRIRVHLPGKDAKRVKGKLEPLFAHVEDEQFTRSALIVVALIDPGAYRQIMEIVQSDTRGQGSASVLNLCVADESSQSSSSSSSSATN